MSRYVDADKVLKIVNDMTECEDDYERITEWIHNMSSIDIVRCKECKYWQDNNGGYPHEECRWSKDETPDADDFCSYGERKE